MADPQPTGPNSNREAVSAGADRTGQPSTSTPTGSSLPTISLPTGGGAIRGIGEKMAVNPVTGTASLTVPVGTSASRGDFAPQLALSYDSGSGNGPYGVGWQLPLPSISRKTADRLPRYLDGDESDVFVLSGSEDLVPVLVETNGTSARTSTTAIEGGHTYRVDAYRPRVEGLYARIERWTDSTGEVHWRTVSTDNVTTLYGRSAESRISDPDDPGRVATWLIGESFDDRGNAVLYRYVAEDSAGVDTTLASERNRTATSRSAQRYIKRITYGNRTPHRAGDDIRTRSDWMFEVVFDYGEHYDEDATGQPTLVNAQPQRPWRVRDDPFSSYRAGFEVRTYRRCERVLMFHHFAELGTADYLVRALHLTYRETPVVSFISSITSSGYVRQPTGEYLKRSVPPLELTYTEATLHTDVRDVAPSSLAALPAGLERSEWVDLDGDGVAGVLAAHDGAWYYVPNHSPLAPSGRGDGAELRFGPIRQVASRPTGGSVRWLDVAGDGQSDLVQLSGTLSGYHERAGDGDWQRFVPFLATPQVRWDSEGVTLIDLTGDGRPDVLVTEDDALTWYESRGPDGFTAAERVVNRLDEERGPRVLLQDPEQTIHLVDLSGDGLPDLVRIRNGEVCYWPNLGFGQFGAKVTMDDAPWFDHDFDPRRLRFADVDGSGPTDLLYLSEAGVHVYANESGNRWGARQEISAFPLVDRDGSVQIVDVFGNGTACLLWSSVQLAEAGRQLRYLDLMGGRKPHLLTTIANNLGAVSRITYSSSARFRLEDELAGRPWATRLPFPVQVVERVETEDLVNRTRFTTRYAYHHGYFDGTEREFRGFGLVEQYDTEELAVLSTSAELPASGNLDPASHVPPALTRSWFHTGAWLDGEQLTARYEREYYREPGLDPSEARAMLLPDIDLPSDLSPDEAREAARALKGVLLRKEVFGLDGSPAELHPYTVTELSYSVERKQSRGDNRHAVFCTHGAESVEMQYERATFLAAGTAVADPRTHHTLVLDVDEFGHALQTVEIVYGRRHVDPELAAVDQAVQRRAHVTLKTARYTNPVDRPDAYRAPQLCESSTYELLHVVPDAGSASPTLLPAASLRPLVAVASDGFHEIPFEDTNGSGAAPGQPFRRLAERTRTLYRRDDMTGPLPFGAVESLVLPFEVYTLAFTPALLTQVFGGRVTDAMLTEGGYVHLDGSPEWWSPSGRVAYSPDPAPTPAEELAHARLHFFIPRRLIDPFGNTSSVRYDAHDLLLLETRDAVGNVVSSGERAIDGTVTSALDYRVLQPLVVTDPNRNRTATAYDALGYVAGVAVMGKPGEGVGDTLAGFVADPNPAALDQFLADPFGRAPSLLAGATRRMVYDVDRFRRTGNPTYAATLARETRGTPETRIHLRFVHSNGLGATVQEKAVAPPGPIVAGGPPAARRWIGTGWTIVDNKGQPVKQYEPFYSATHEFEFARVAGVSGTSLYDPIGRKVASLHADHTYDKTVFGPWRQEAWDANDTVLISDPAADPDVGDHFARLPVADYLPTWHARRAGGGLGPVEQQAAVKAAAHAATPPVSHYDPLGRPFLTVQDNGPVGSIATRLVHDFAGNVRAIVDGLGRTVVRGDYDLQARRLHHETIDGGARFDLPDILGQTLRAWDSRGQMVRHVSDALRRPTDVFVTAGIEPERLVERVVYGESVGDAKNHRGHVFQRMDSAGIVSEEAIDLDGNLLAQVRQLAADDRVDPDWSRSVALDVEQHRSSTFYDALKRPTRVVSPDGTITHLTYDEQGELARLEANVRGEANATVFLTRVDRNARGQTLRAELGNGAITENDYDPETFRLRRTVTLRGTTTLIDLSYVYDAAGNVTARRDGAQQTEFFANSVVEPHADFTYDAIYRLIAASGREHRGQGPQTPEFEPHDAPRTGLAHPQDGQAMRRYTEQYAYDAVGNLLSVAHQATAGNWSRRYEYEDGSNRLRSTSLPGDPADGPLPVRYTYDAHGSMTSLPHLRAMDWDFRDRLRTVDLGGGGTATYVYDAAGERIRKVIRRQNGTKHRERIYVGALEIFREYAGDGTTVTLERQTLLPQPGRPAHVETRTVGTDLGPARLVRHQFADVLGSVTLELDETARIISYEEYHPYGGTAYQATRSQTETPKRYRFNGKERDDETGLYYYGARYYAASIGRWTSVDPAGLIDGVNVYVYARNNPAGISDPTGHEGLDLSKQPPGHFVQIPFSSEKACEDAGHQGCLVKFDGTVIALGWQVELPAKITPGKPQPKAAPPPPKKVAKPAKEPPVDVRTLFRIARAIGPGWHYGPEAMRVFGGIQFVGGTFEAAGGAVGGLFLSPTVGGAIAGAAVAAHGVDQLTSGWTTMWTGKPSKTNVYKFGEFTASRFSDDPEWHQFGGQFAEAGASFGSMAYGYHIAVQPVDLAPMMAKLPPMPTPITELEYINITNRPGSAVALGQYGPYGDHGLTIGEHYWMDQALNRGARTLGTYDATPKWIRNVGAPGDHSVLLWWEKGYLMDAEHIWFFRTGFESPTATPITWLEIEMIAADPALAAKATDVPLLHNPMIRPVPKPAPTP
jgi:RHS repeat-associated protein